MQKTNLLKNWIEELLQVKNPNINTNLEWLEETTDRLKTSNILKSPNLFFTRFSLASRFFSKECLTFTLEKLKNLSSIDSDIIPTSITLLEWVRIYFLLSLPWEENSKECSDILDSLLKYADFNEIISLGKALPFLPSPESHIERAQLILRTNAKDIFESVAHNNPYPKRFFSEDSWNQMVLKTIFIESTLKPIVGIDEKANLRLKEMLVDFAHERQKAKRPVPPDLWRSVGPFIEEGDLEEFSSLYVNGTDDDIKGIGLALFSSPIGKEKIEQILSHHTEIKNKIIKGDITWKSI